MKNPSKTINAVEFHTFYLSSFCYGWKRNGAWLYIGKTKQAGGRFANHHIINKITPVQPDDEFVFWYYTDPQEGADLEMVLINEYKPVFNTQGVFYPAGTPRPTTDLMLNCPVCNKPFFQTKRDWQLYCSKECRTKVNNEKRKERKTEVWQVINCAHEGCKTAVNSSNLRPRKFCRDHEPQEPKL